MESSRRFPSAKGEGARSSPPPWGRVREGVVVVLLLGACATTPPGPVGDPVRGREVFVSREAGHCVLCHRVPGVDRAGDVGPALAGIGSRLTADEIRVRVADITRIHPDSVMPTFHRTEGMRRVSKAYEGKPVLDAQQLEDVVAWLGNLK